MYQIVYWNFKHLTYVANHIAVYNNCCIAQCFESRSVPKILLVGQTLKLKLVDWFYTFYTALRRLIQCMYY